ncbi:MAG TPA: hypothetical protein DEV85_11810 [Vibrio sp.]|nr:hypothetical protein [Vibrio sp.]
MLSFLFLNQLGFRFDNEFIQLESYHAVIRVDRQLSEFGLQLLLKNGQVLRLMRHQFDRDEYKKLNVLLDEGESNLSICLLPLKKRQESR